MDNNGKNAFTLAEVLIVLAIIGVVAAITIPALMQSTQDQELKTAWKKEFSVISNATNMLANDNGGSIAGLCTDGDTNCLMNLYKPYFSYQKTCVQSQVNGKCWPNFGSFWDLDGTVVAASEVDLPVYTGLVLNDGALAVFVLDSGACTYSGWSSTRCGRILIDTNGLKGPNKFGKDMFLVHLLKNQIKPYGTSEDSVKNFCAGSIGVYSGWGCAAEYLYQ